MAQRNTLDAATPIRDFMTSPVSTISMDDSIMSAKALFDRRRFHHAVVLEHRRAVGVVSDRDILKVISPFVGNEMMERPQDAETLKKHVHQIMTRALVTIGQDETAAAAAKKMLRERVSCLPVVDGRGAPLGIVTLRDIVALTAKSADKEHAGRSG